MIKEKILSLLSNSSSQKPVDVVIRGISKSSVNAALEEMYKARQVMCCTFIKGKEKPVVKWWIVGVLPQTPSQMLKSAVRKKRAAKQAEEFEDE